MDRPDENILHSGNRVEMEESILQLQDNVSKETLDNEETMPFMGERWTMKRGSRRLWTLFTRLRSKEKAYFTALFVATISFVLDKLFKRIFQVNLQHVAQCCFVSLVPRFYLVILLWVLLNLSAFHMYTFYCRYAQRSDCDEDV